MKKKIIDNPKEFMQKIAFNYARMKDEKDAPDNETWEAKVLRRKLTAEKVNKAIGYDINPSAT